MPETAPETCRPRPRREGWLLAAILLIGLLLRLTYLVEISRAPDFDLPQFESQYHDYWARALVTGEWTPPADVTDPEIRQRPFFRPPGYPYFLAGVYRVFGLGYVWPRVAQMLLGLVSCWLVARFTRRWYGAAAGLGAAVLMAVSWIFLFFEGEFMAPALLILLLAAALRTVAAWVDAFTVGRAAAAGLLLGLAALVRPNVLVVVAACLVWAAWLTRRRGQKLGAAFLRPALAFTAAAALAILPATVRNLRVAGDLVGITSNAGINLFVGTHPDSDGTTPGVPELGEITGLTGWDSFDYPKIAAAVERLEGRPMRDSEISRFFARRALEHARQRPWDVARLLAKKTALFWGPAEISNNKVLGIERQRSPSLRLGPSFATVLALALLGTAWLILDARRPGAAPAAGRREVTVLLWLVVAVYFASFLPFFAAARFRVPLIPLLIVFAGAGLGHLWQALAARRWRQLGLALAALLALRAGTGIAWVPHEDDPALWHWRQGLLWEQRGDTGRAVDAWRQALAADPAHTEARLALADALAGQNQLAEAVAEYRTTLELVPDSLPAHNNLATALARQGDAAGAVEHWAAALELDPERVSVLNNLAYALATHPDPAIRNPPRAVELAQRACLLTAYRDPRVVATLAVALRAAGREEEAEELLRRGAGSPHPP